MSRSCRLLLASVLCSCSSSYPRSSGLSLRRQQWQQFLSVFDFGAFCILPGRNGSSTAALALSVTSLRAVMSLILCSCRTESRASSAGIWDAFVGPTSCMPHPRHRLSQGPQGAARQPTTETDTKSLMCQHKRELLEALPTWTTLPDMCRAL